MTSEHRLQFFDGHRGLGLVGIPDDPPRWACNCGVWKFYGHTRPVAAREHMLLGRRFESGPGHVRGLIGDQQ